MYILCDARVDVVDAARAQGWARDQVPHPFFQLLYVRIRIMLKATPTLLQWTTQSEVP